MSPEALQILLDSLSDEWQAVLRLAPRAALAGVVVGISVLIGRLSSAAVGRVLERAGLSPIQRAFFRRVLAWGLMLLGLAIGLNLMGLQTAAAGLLAGGGITAVILGFAFREIGENFLAGIFLAFSRPFKVGDIIESGDLKGTVRQVELRHTHIRTADGRDIFIPNAQILNRPLVNYTRDGMLRPSFRIGIDYGDDALAACEILSRITGQVEEVLASPPPLVTIAGFEPTYVQLEVVFWVDTFAPGLMVQVVGTRVMDGCRRALREAGYTLSSEVTTTLTLAGGEPLEVRLER